jgi:hypothetical protein
MPAPATLDEYREELTRLRKMGMAFAERLHARIDDPEADIGELAGKFARVSRAVRQTIFLEARLADDERRRAEAIAREEAEAAEPGLHNMGAYTPDDAPWWVTLRMHCSEGIRDAQFRKETAVNLVQRAIAKTPDPQRDYVQQRFFEGLERPDWEVVFSCREAPWSTAYICRELGLSPDWASFTDRDWGKTDPEIRAALIADPLKGAEKILPPPPDPPPPEAYPSDRPMRRSRAPPRAWNA